MYIYGIYADGVIHFCKAHQRKLLKFVQSRDTSSNTNWLSTVSLLNIFFIVFKLLHTFNTLKNKQYYDTYTLIMYPVCMYVAKKTLLDIKLILLLK